MNPMDPDGAPETVAVRTVAEEWESPLSRYFRRGTDRGRRLYAAFRRLAHFPTVRRHRRLAALHAGEATFEIPRDQGFLSFAPDRFEEVPGIVSEARRTADGQWNDPRGSKKMFLVNRLDPATLRLDSPLVRLALRPDILAAVSNYLGMVPIFSYAAVYRSEHAPAPKLRSSQIFHCDSDDVSHVKIFVLCNDVGPANGPLTILPAALSERVRRRLGYRFAERLRDEQAEAVLGSRPWQPMTGPAGTLLFVDTSRCFHFGSRVEEGAEPRVVAMIQYLTPFSFLLPGPRETAVYRHLVEASLTPLQRLVLTGA